MDYASFREITQLQVSLWDWGYVSLIENNSFVFSVFV